MVATSDSDNRLTPTYLADLHPHPRDSCITFREYDHKYFVKDDPASYVSVTTLIHGFFSQFDADKIIKKMMASKTWPQSKYFGKTPDEIKDMWEKNRDEAATAGTKMHYVIECFYNGNSEPLDNDTSLELKYFREYHNDNPFEPYRTEWIVFDEDVKIAGSIDMIYADPSDPTHNTLYIYDWKRSKEIKLMNPFQSGKGPLSDLTDANYVHYSLQLNIYKRILETKYGKKITRLNLVVLHPSNDTYKIISVQDMSHHVDLIWEYLKTHGNQNLPGTH